MFECQDLEAILSSESCSLRHSKWPATMSVSHRLQMPKHNVSQAVATRRQVISLSLALLIACSSTLTNCLQHTQHDVHKPTASSHPTSIVITQKQQQQQQQQQQQASAEGVAVLAEARANAGPERRRRRRHTRDNYELQQQQQQQQLRNKRGALTALVTSSASSAALQELRAVSGSKNEPPSRPTVDWSRQRPYFGPDMERNVSIELGKTAYLTCKVYELGDKTVSWLRPRENEILTAGRYTYVGDPRFASINDNGSHDWILEIKDVNLNDSTSYECQVSTDPKMSTIINLHVKAAKARIKQGEQFYAPVGANIEFSCDSVPVAAALATKSQLLSHLSHNQQHQQTYWYFNGNLLNYARAMTHAAQSSSLVMSHNDITYNKNFNIEWDPLTHTSRFKLTNVQSHDAGNYTCKPTSAEPATIRLHVKRYNNNKNRDRSQLANGYHTAGYKDVPRNSRQQHGEASGLVEFADANYANTANNNNMPLSIVPLCAALISCFITLLLHSQMYQMLSGEKNVAA